MKNRSLSEQERLQDLTLKLLALIQPHATVAEFVSYFQSRMAFTQVSVWRRSASGWRLIAESQAVSRTDAVVCRDFYFEPSPTGAAHGTDIQ